MTIWNYNGNLRETFGIIAKQIFMINFLYIHGSTSQNCGWFQLETLFQFSLSYVLFTENMQAFDIRICRVLRLVIPSMGMEESSD